MLRVDELTAARRAAKRWRTAAILSWVVAFGVGGWLLYAQHQDAQHQRQAERAAYCERYDVGSLDYFTCLESG